MIITNKIKQLFLRILLLILFIQVVLIFVFTFKNNQAAKAKKPETASTETILGKITNASKIEVVHFHATNQCSSCKALGEYTLEFVKNKLSQQYQDGIITFTSINVDLPENKDIVTKYQARGSSLYFNAIVNNQDNIEEDANVWRLIGDKEQLFNYLEEKITQMLAKEVKN